MNKLTLTVPNRDNDGTSLYDLHSQCRMFLREVYGGFTSLDVFGEWDDETGKTYRERSTLYLVYTDKTIDSLYPLCQKVKKDGQQKCVLITEEIVKMECQ